MYVCICNAIRERDFRLAARKSKGSAADIYGEFGKAPKCGQCLEDAEAIAGEERMMARLPMLT